MSGWNEILVDLAIVTVFVGGIAQFRSPQGARRGNLTAALAFALALGLLVSRHTFVSPALAVGAFLIGGVAGWLVSARIDMRGVPALVALQNGAGGGAACLVAYVELLASRAGTGADAATIDTVFGQLALGIGGATLAGSLVAAGRLSGRLGQRPRVLRGHNLLLLLLLAAVVVAGAVSVAGGVDARGVLLAGAVLAALGLGGLFAMRVGGADMPVLISFLNALSGLAGAFVGVSIGNPMLIAAGAMVGSSGSILTLVMCRNMNRSLGGVLLGRRMATAPAETGPTDDGHAVAAPPAAAPPVAEPPAEGPPAQAAPGATGDPLERARRALAEAASVIIVPGYGMAQAQAQFEVARLAETLVDRGASVRFGVHPVAGRMPGHMHVLLAEAGIDYDMLFEMDDINDEFSSADVALVVGACDVVNPAAITAKDTPISGMPILRVHEARTVVVCNLDDRPGYSGVPNPLYEDPSVVLLFGDAKETVARLIDR